MSIALIFWGLVCFVVLPIGCAGLALLLVCKAAAQYRVGNYTYHLFSFLFSATLINAYFYSQRFQLFHLITCINVSTFAMIYCGLQIREISLESKRIEQQLKERTSV